MIRVLYDFVDASIDGVHFFKVRKESIEDVSFGNGKRSGIVNKNKLPVGAVGQDSPHVAILLLGTLP